MTERKKELCGTIGAAIGWVIIGMLVIASATHMVSTFGVYLTVSILVVALFINRMGK